MPRELEIDRKPLFSARLREAIKAKGLTQDAFAREIDLPFSTVQAWLHRRSEPRADRLIRISEVLDREPAWFYTEYEDVAA